MKLTRKDYITVIAEHFRKSLLLSTDSEDPEIVQYSVAEEA